MHAFGAHLFLDRCKKPHRPQLFADPFGIRQSSPSHDMKFPTDKSRPLRDGFSEGFYFFMAMTSISTFTSLGRRATSTQERAGSTSPVK